MADASADPLQSGYTRSYTDETSARSTTTAASSKGHRLRRPATADLPGEDAMKKPAIEIDLPRAFKVRRYALDDLTTLTEEIIWAHSYTLLDGATVFVLLKVKDIRVVDEAGNITVEQGVTQNYIRSLAPDTWYDVTEEVIPQVKPGAAVN